MVATQTVSISVCRACGNTFDIGVRLLDAHAFNKVQKTCPSCLDKAQGKPAEATVLSRELIGWADNSTVDVDVSRFTFKPARAGERDSGCWKGTLKQRMPRPKPINGQPPAGTDMPRIEVYDHRDVWEQDRSKLNGRVARVEVTLVEHEAGVTRTFTHHRYETSKGIEFTRGYRLADEVAEAKGLRWLGPVEIEKTFKPDFTYIRLYPAAQQLPGARLVITADNVVLHERAEDGLPVFTSDGQPIFHPQPSTAGSVLPEWELLWEGDFLALFQTDVFGRVSALYASRSESADWYAETIAAFDSVVFSLGNAGTLPPNAEKRWERIAKLRATGAPDSGATEAEALTALKLALEALERLTGFEPEEAQQ